MTKLLHPLVMVGALAFSIPCPAVNLTPDWINIKDYGAVGNGTTDDTAAIQAAIDAAFAGNIHTVYCPATSSSYIVSDTIWLDPPGNMRAQTWSGTGTINGATFTRTGTTSGQLAIGSYIHGSGTLGGTWITGGSDPNWIVTNDGNQVVSGSLTAFNPTNPTQGQFTMAFTGDPTSGGTMGGSFGGKCQIQVTPVPGSAPAFVVGTGQSMYVGNLAIRGSSIVYRGNQPATSSGIAIQGGPSGASGTLIENTDVENFYSCYTTDPFESVGDSPLADSNTFRKVNAANCYAGINLAGTQSFINMIYDPRISNTTVGIYNAYAHQVEVYGGNISANGGAYATLNVSGTSNLFNGAPCAGGVHECFQTTLGAADPYVNTVYNAYTITTTQHGIIPLDLVAYNTSTRLATFELHFPWLLSSYGHVASIDPVLQSDIQFPTQITATEKVEVFHGIGINSIGTHIENSQGCTSLAILDTVWTGSNRTSITDPLFDYDYSLISQAPVPQVKCQTVFPLIGTSQDQVFDVNLDGGNYSAGMAAAPVVIELPQQTRLLANQLFASTMMGNGFPQFNIRVWDSWGCSYGLVADPTGLGYPSCNGLNRQTVSRGAGVFDRDYSLPTIFKPTMVVDSSLGEVTGPYCGFELCPWVVPQMNAQTFAKVCPNPTGGLTVGSAITCSGSVGALGSFMPIAPRTAYKYLDWNTGTLSRPLFIRSSNSQPGYSYGQNLNAGSTGGSPYTFTGSVSGTTLTTSLANQISPGQQITGTGVPAGTYVVDTIDSTHSRLNHSFTVASESLTEPPFTWAFQGGSNTVYLDTYALEYLFPGLGITLNGNPYVVTGVYPHFGYATVIFAGTQTGGPLQGTGPFFCTSGCSLGQSAFAFSAY